VQQGSEWCVSPMAVLCNRGVNGVCVTDGVFVQQGFCIYIH